MLPLNCWPNSTIACIASGTSLTQADVDFLHGKCRIIAINDNVLKAPWADVLYFADVKWWKWHRFVVNNFQGLKVSIENHGADKVLDSDVIVLDNLDFGSTTSGRLSRDPRGIHTGRNSGYQAINVAILLGASKIILLGYDMKPGKDGKNHWFGEHPDNSRMDYVDWRLEFSRMAPTADRMGIEILNATRSTDLDCFPKVDLESVLFTEESAVLSA